jgi:hypothetical protein
MPKPKLAERPFDPRKIALIDREVEVEMISRLRANQRIDAPAAVNPHADVVLRKGLQHLADIFCRHAFDLT